MTTTNLRSAFEDPDASILVHEKPSNDRNGNSRARQSVYDANGMLIYTDGHRRSAWYGLENERRKFEQRGGKVLTP